MNHDHLEHDIEKKYAKRDTKRRAKMKVTGKSIFTLQQLMTQRKAERAQKLSKQAKNIAQKKNH